MITYVFLGFVAICSFIALQNWRAGVLLWLGIAILQDPIRKVTPDNPVWLTISFVPVYLAAFFGMLQANVHIRDFTRRFRQLDNSFKLFLLTVFASLCISLIGSRQGVLRSAVGVISYAGGVPAVLIGYFYLRNNYSSLDRLMMWFTIFTSIMLIGVPMQHTGVELSQPWLGTIGLEGGHHRRWFNDFDYVEMISGFYRSPEIMGWHAMILVLASVYLLLKMPRLNLLWIAMSIWGSYGVFMSGRRKMLMMLVVFVLVLFLASGFRSKKKILGYLVPALIFIIPGIAWLVDDLYLMSFNSGLGVAGAKVAEKGLAGPLWLMTIVGPFGYGVGSVSQGAQHFGMVTDVPLVEGGFEKVMVELGLFGAVCGIVLAVSVMLTAIKVVRRANRSMPNEIATSFCFALIVANLSAFLTAFQFLGDPFIATFVGFLFGVLLSSERLYGFRLPTIPADQPAVAVPVEMTWPVRQESNLAVPQKPR